jgi:hypothetical protein
MKSKLTNVFLATVLLGTLFASHCDAAVTFSGPMASGLKKNDNSTLEPNGNLFLVIVDADNSGSFAASTANAIAANTTLNIGDTFGTGDKIIYRGATAGGLNGTANATINLSNFDASSYLGQKIALVWFDTLTSAITSASNNSFFGIQTGDATWKMPATNAGTITFGSTATKITSPGFAALVVGAPEPSRVMLAAMGLGAFVLRRRRQA